MIIEFYKCGYCNQLFNDNELNGEQFAKLNCPICETKGRKGSLIPVLPVVEPDKNSAIFDKVL